MGRVKGLPSAGSLTEEEDFEVFDLARTGAEARDNASGDLVRLLLGVGRACVDIQCVGLGIVLHGDVGFHSHRPSVADV